MNMRIIIRKQNTSQLRQLDGFCCLDVVKKAIRSNVTSGRLGVEYIVRALLLFAWFYLFIIVLAAPFF